LFLDSDEVKEDSTDEEEEDRRLLKQINDDHKKELKKLVFRVYIFWLCNKVHVFFFSKNCSVPIIFIYNILLTAVARQHSNIHLSFA
jgi:hypothetical protein